MAENTDTQASQEALKPLDALVGEWKLEISHPLIPGILRGRATFEWLEGGYFLIERSSIEHPDFPFGLFVIGYDEEAGHYKMHYFDSRGITRLYDMELRDGVWKMWRDDPDFSQRFTGTFSGPEGAKDGDTITGYYELSRDGSNWEHDFDLTYRKSSKLEKGG